MPCFEIEILPQCFAILRLGSEVPLPTELLDQAFVWIGRTESEFSIVCPATLCKHFENEIDRVDPAWRALRIRGPLALSMIGVLHELTAILARIDVSVFALSTFDTDTILVKEERLAAARAALEANGHILHSSPWT